MTHPARQFRRRSTLLTVVCAFVLVAAASASSAAGAETPLVAAGGISDGSVAMPAGIFEIDVGAPAGDAVYFGSILTKECFFRPDGKPSCVDGALLRLREENNAGGLDGKPVRLLAVWDEGTEAGNVRAAKTLQQDPRVTAVIGPHSSGPARAILAGIPAGYAGPAFFSSTATGDGLVTPDGWLFSVLWPDSTQAKAMARYLAGERGFTRGLVVVESDSTYSQGLGSAFREVFAESGGSATLFQLQAQDGEELALDDFSQPVGDAIESGAQFVFLPDSAVNIAHFVRQAGRQKLDAAVILCGGDTWDHSDVYGGSGNRLTGSLFTSPFAPPDPEHPDPDARLDAFSRRMALSQADVRGINLDTMLTYDTVDMMFAAAKAKGATRQGMRDGWFALQDVPLITGTTSVSESGIIRRDVFLMRIEETADGYASRLLERIPSE